MVVRSGTDVENVENSMSTQQEVMPSMSDAVRKLQPTPTDIRPTGDGDYKTKILQEYTADEENAGLSMGGWLAWVCPF